MVANSEVPHRCKLKICRDCREIIMMSTMAKEVDIEQIIKRHPKLLIYKEITKWTNIRIAIPRIIRVVLRLAPRKKFGRNLNLRKKGKEWWNLMNQRVWPRRMLELTLMKCEIALNTNGLSQVSINSKIKN